MIGSFPVGRILGIEVRIDYSWFVILLLVIGTFSFIVFPLQHPELSRPVHVAMGLSAALFFFVSLLAHELSHAIVALRKGIPVEGITLFLFGGVARTRREPDRPWDEFVIAAVGPVTSIAISVLLGALALLGERFGVSPAVTGVAIYLAVLNLVLAIFNLLPGFPLDGGRIFRSLAWRVTGDLTRATRWATVAGMLIGFLIMGMGGWQVISGLRLSGLWLVFIGWFIRGAAVRSWQQHLLQGAHSRSVAGDAMTRDPETLSTELDLERAVEGHFVPRPYDAFPVDRAGRPAGLITFAQVSRVPREDWPARRVGEVMTPIDELVVVGADRPMEDVVRAMNDAGARWALVLAQDGRLAGIITAGDVIAWANRFVGPARGRAAEA